MSIFEYRFDQTVFRLKEDRDFSWLKEFGHVFSAIDATGSGCLCLGIEQNGEKRFFKIAGAETLHAEITAEESVFLLKKAVGIYRDIQHPNLIRCLDTFMHDDLFIAVFEWAEGECLFDHWNFDYYGEHPEVKTPGQRFCELPLNRKMDTAEILFDFFETYIEAGYAAVDFYDASILYDFEKDSVMFCDIDLFEKMPCVNTKGTEWFGTKRLKAPEENKKGAAIDELTGVFTLGALLTDLFSQKDTDNIRERYRRGLFIAPQRDQCNLNDALWSVLTKAVSYERSSRYPSLHAFHQAWNLAAGGLTVTMYE